MVNADRVKRKLPSLLIDGNTTTKKYWAARRKISYRLDQLKKHNPTQYYSLETRLVAVLNDINTVISE